MYEYKFVKIYLKGFVSHKPREDYHRIIDEHAREGWRLVQIFAPSVVVLSGGTPESFELIFERSR